MLNYTVQCSTLFAYAVHQEMQYLMQKTTRHCTVYITSTIYEETRTHEQNAVVYLAVELNKKNTSLHPTHVADGVVGSQHPCVIVHPKEGSS